jgi:hypothetical protein
MDGKSGKGFEGGLNVLRMDWKVVGMGMAGWKNFGGS